MLPIDLTNRRALVTGANSGIGAAVAEKLAEAGADVAVNYLVGPEQAETIADAIGGRGRKAQIIQADISSEPDVSRMIDEVIANWGGLDILVNNAGIDGGRALGWDADPAHWRRVLEVNLFGTFLMSRAALRHMIPRGHGVIINVSSVHEVIPWSGFSAYTASKAGVSMLTKTLAQEAAPHGVRVLSVAPGAVKTPINKSVWSDPEGRADLQKKIPMNRIGEPDEIAAMVALLTSDQASYVTGTTVFVDGGMLDFASFAHGG